MFRSSRICIYCLRSFSSYHLYSCFIFRLHLCLWLCVCVRTLYVCVFCAACSSCFDLTILFNIFFLLDSLILNFMFSFSSHAQFLFDSNSVSLCACAVLLVRVFWFLPRHKLQANSISLYKCYFFFLLNKYLLIFPHLVLVECEFVKKQQAVKMWGEIADRMN